MYLIFRKAEKARIAAEKLAAEEAEAARYFQNFDYLYPWLITIFSLRLQEAARAAEEEAAKWDHPCRSKAHSNIILYFQESWGREASGRRGSKVSH